MAGETSGKVLWAWTTSGRNRRTASSTRATPRGACGASKAVRSRSSGVRISSLWKVSVSTVQPARASASASCATTASSPPRI